MAGLKGLGELSEVQIIVLKILSDRVVSPAASVGGNLVFMSCDFNVHRISDPRTI